MTRLTPTGSGESEWLDKILLVILPIEHAGIYDPDGNTVIKDLNERARDQAKAVILDHLEAAVRSAREDELKKVKVPQVYFVECREIEKYIVDRLSELRHTPSDNETAQAEGSAAA